MEIGFKCVPNCARSWGVEQARWEGAVRGATDRFSPFYPAWRVSSGADCRASPGFCGGPAPGVGTIRPPQRSAMRFSVCINQVPDVAAPSQVRDGQLILDAGRVVLDAYAASAVEAALVLQEAHGGEVEVVLIGPAKASETIRKALAMGADRAGPTSPTPSRWRRRATRSSSRARATEGRRSSSSPRPAW